MYGWRAQVGFIVPANNTVIEPELYHVVPEGVSFHFTKLMFGRPSTDGKNQDADGEAVAVLQRAGVDAIMYACMATSLVDATQWERETAARTGIPAGTAANALKEALRAIGASSVALVCHYTPDRLPLVKDSFRADGFNVASVETANVADARQVNRVSTEEVYRMARKADRPEVDAVCLLATDLRSFPILQQLEEDLGKPVVSSNQTILWKALQLASVKVSIPGYGSLLSGAASEKAAAGRRRR
ncbi:MAG: aspartate/glutamate racemase family protein [Chloroflexi bacterium]|nr:aspartate/glutamate racemase family protein [Chloroflexota bacterium]